MSEIEYSIEKYPDSEWFIWGKHKDNRTLIAKCRSKGTALTIKGMYEETEKEYQKWEELQSENEKLKGLIERYGTEPSKFDWGILETIDELETELENKNEKINAVKIAIEAISQALKETKQ